MGMQKKNQGREETGTTHWRQNKEETGQETKEEQGVENKKENCGEKVGKNMRKERFWKNREEDSGT